jgi:HK97 family phage portal protein
VLGNALALQEFSKRAWQNGATPSGAFEFPGNLSPENFARIRSHVQDSYEGSHNAKRVMILDGGAKWTAMSLSMEDAETLASRKFSVEELCRLYNVPPPLVQSYDHNTFTNAQQADLWFASRTLLPWCRKIESEFQRSIFGSASPFSLELDLSGLTRGDPATRWAAYAIARTNNILTIDEIREAEGYGPLAAVAPNRAAIAE